MKSYQMKMKTVAALPSFLLATFATGVSSDKTVPILANATFSEPDAVRTSSIMAQTENNQTFNYSERAQVWTRKMAKRFETLAILEATGKLTSEQKNELETLARDRRNAEYPRTGDDIIWGHKQRQITAKLLDAVTEYVQFYRATDNQEKSS